MNIEVMKYNFLGHIINHEHIRTLPEKTEERSKHLEMLMMYEHFS